MFFELKKEFQHECAQLLAQLQLEVQFCLIVEMESSFLNHTTEYELNVCYIYNHWIDERMLNMAKSVVLAEKPSVARDIARVLKL